MTNRVQGPRAVLGRQGISSKVIQGALGWGLVWGCTYDPPTRSADYYVNPHRYEDDSKSHPARSRLQAYLDEAVADGLPGVAMLVRSPTNGTWAGASGFADISNDVEWTPSMLGRVGSVTKMFAAAVAFRLAEQGELDLDDRVNKYIKGPPVEEISNAAQATIRQLLNHTSGIYDYLSAWDLSLEKFGAYDAEYQTTEQLLEFAYDEPAYFAPGTGWKYSNTNYLLLELVLEKASGRDAQELMRSLVLEPLKLESTMYAPDAPNPRGLVRGYSDVFGDGELIDASDLELERFHYDGGIVSTVYDIADFLDALLGRSFLSERSLEQMQHTVSTHGKSERGTDHYGQGIILEKHSKYGPIWGHLGVAMGFTAHAYKIVDHGITFVAIVNGSQGTISERSFEWFGPLKSDSIVELVMETGE